MQHQLVTHRELVALAAKWAAKRRPVVVTELVTDGPETPDVLAFGGIGSLLIECKVSHSDFLADGRKLFRRYPRDGLGRLRYYCAPKGLISIDELPPKWGLIELVNGKLRMKFEAKRRNHWNANNEVKILVSVLRRIYSLEGRGVSIRQFVHETECTATVSVEVENG